VFLFVEDRVPPDVEETVRESGSTHEEGTEIEAGAVLGDDYIDRFRAVVAGRRCGNGIEDVADGRVSDVEGIVVVDVSVCVGGEVVEKVHLQGD
jgi:hypothetical protein